MTDARCTETGILERECGHCLGHTRPDVRDWAAGQPFHAHAPGRCPRCGHEWSAGDLIARLADGSGHVDLICAD
jgi:hypothetical protein